MQGGKHMSSERQLDFHAPLLSTRRPGRIIVPREKWELDSSSDRVPFSWEQSPGKPKEARKYVENKSKLANILPLKPPPIRLPPRSRDSSEDHRDDGCDGDVDEDEDEDVDFFSGGLDLFSLAESSQNGKDRRNERKMAKRRAPPATPSFMMERFLPDAVALAAESLEAMVTESEAEAEAEATPRVAGGAGRRVLLSVTSPLGLKSCGLENLLPWRARPKKSVVKGPMKFGCADWKMQLSPRPN